MGDAGWRVGDPAATEQASGWLRGALATRIQQALSASQVLRPSLTNHPGVGDAARVPWGLPLVLTVLLAAGALLPDPTLRDAVTRESVADVTLERPLGYVVLAPFCQALDALTLLSSSQHAALVTTLVVLLVAWRAVHGLRRGTRRLRDDLVAVATGVLLLAGAYAFTIVPRPMAALHVADPDVVVVDFHSHTNASPDTRRSFTVARNRAWHRAGGWHAAYVTDHLTVEGAMHGMATNPARAGDDTVLLPGVEIRGNGLMLLALGMSKAELAVLEPAVQPQGPRPRSTRDHTVIIAIPGDIEWAAGRTRTRAGTPVAIEVSDAGTAGLDQIQREHAALVAAARRGNFATVAGSNTHGWSHTPPAWSLLRIPGWRALTPAALGARIEALLRQERSAAVRVVERYVADPDATPFGLAATLPAIVWHVLATLTSAERLACLAWIWGAAFGVRRLRARVAGWRAS